MFHQTHAISSLNFRRELIPIPLGQGLIRELSSARRSPARSFVEALTLMHSACGRVAIDPTVGAALPLTA